MAKDPCEATVTKRLAWLVEQLVVSTHEIFFNHFYLLFLFVLKINLKTTSFIFLSSFSLPSLAITSGFLFFSFFHSLTKNNY